MYLHLMIVLLINISCFRSSEENRYVKAKEDDITDEETLAYLNVCKSYIVFCYTITYTYVHVNV